MFVSVYALAEFADGNKNARWFELLRFSSGLAIIYFYNGWFGIDNLFGGATYALIGYMLCSMIFVNEMNRHHSAFDLEKA
jgi:hypothetical protein